MKFITTVLCLVLVRLCFSQTTVDIYPDTLQGLVPITYKPGVFYVPKTEVGAADFNTNGIYQNATRSYVIESVLNNSTNLDECLALMATVEEELVAISNKCEKLILIFEKMPAWLSSSDDSSPAGTPGWAVLHTKPPADWEAWGTVVSALVSQLVVDFEIDNIWIEVWNEPDLGSWTGSKAEYFELYKRTYDAVKSVDSDIPVGGPAVNFWANNIYWHPVTGYISDAIADSSLISELLDFGIENDRSPDFISWHNFNLSHQEFGLGTAYIRRKCESISMPIPPLIISEWNAPSVTREIPVHKSFIVKGQMEIAKANLDNQMIAAWQDFEEEPSEFHADYGMLTWGGIHKPAYYATLMFNEMQGALCKTEAEDPYVMSVSAYDDTLYILLANYCPPPLVEALNHTLYEGGYNLSQLDSAGFIDIAMGDITYLEGIYEGETIITDDSPMHEAINASIPIYDFYKFYETNPHTFMLNLEGFEANYLGSEFMVNDTVNNNQFRFDSLQIAGFSREDAVDQILVNQNLDGVPVSFLGGLKTITLDPNTIIFFKIGVAGVGEIAEKSALADFQLYPNPILEALTISGLTDAAEFVVFDLQGKRVKSIKANLANEPINMAELHQGVYLIGRADGTGVFKKFVKN